MPVPLRNITAPPAFISRVPGLSLDEYTRMRAFFAQRGIDFAHVPKGWRFCKWIAGRAQMAIIWCGPGTVREHLDNPEGLVASIAALEAQVLSAQQ